MVNAEEENDACTSKMGKHVLLWLTDTFDGWTHDI